MRTIKDKRGLRWLRAQVADGTSQVLMVGNPGSGCTFLARQLAATVPAPTGQAAVELAWIYQAARLVWPGAAPFRAPHHTCSLVALLGGGRPARPGELSLAHGGTLYLDEVDEFPWRHVAEMGGATMRGYSTLHGAWGGWFRIPTKPRLVLASAAACPCGHAGGFTHRRRSVRCTCEPDTRGRYDARIERLGAQFELMVRVELRGLSGQMMAYGALHA